MVLVWWSVQFNNLFSLKLPTSLEYTQNLFMNNKLIVCEMISDKLIYFESSFTSILSELVLELVLMVSKDHEP